MDHVWEIGLFDKSVSIQANNALAKYLSNRKSGSRVSNQPFALIPEQGKCGLIVTNSEAND